MSADKEQKQIRGLRITSGRLLVCACLYFEIALNLSLWRFVMANLAVNSAMTMLFAVSLPVFIFIGLYLIFNFLLWPYIYKPVLVALVILSSIANYVMYQYGIFIDSDNLEDEFTIVSHKKK